jgi:hypothetical protein
MALREEPATHEHLVAKQYFNSAEHCGSKPNGR